MSGETVTDHAGDPRYHRNAVLGRMGFVEVVFGGGAAAVAGYLLGGAIGLPPLLVAFVFLTVALGAVAALRMRAVRIARAAEGARRNDEYERRWNAGGFK